MVICQVSQITYACIGIILCMCQVNGRRRYIVTLSLILWVHIPNPCTLLQLTHHFLTLKWRHNERDGVSNHQPHDCLLNRLFRHRSKMLLITGLCAGNSPVTNVFPAQMASNAENVSISWRHHEITTTWRCTLILPIRSLVFLVMWYYVNSAPGISPMILE